MIAIIVAFDKKRVIGNKGKIPWQLNEDKKHFKQLTTGNVVVMGRRTFEEIGYPLPNRYNIIVSSTAKYLTANCTTVASLQAAVDFAAKNFPEKKVFICGGALLYEQAIALADELYVTKIDAEYEGDTFFPEFDENGFDSEVLKTSDFDADDGKKISYKIYIYRRKLSVL